MLHRSVVTLFLLTFSLGLAGGSAWGAGGAQCVRTQCEGPGKACIAALYVTYDACMAAGNQKCNGVPPADKFTCLRTELSPCARERNSQQAACLSDVQSCYTTCAPMEGERADYWCVGNVGNERKAIFCEANPSDPNILAFCERQMSDGPPASLTCEPL